MTRLAPLLAAAILVLAARPAAADRCADGVAAAGDAERDPIRGLLDLATCAGDAATSDAVEAARTRLVRRAERTGASRVELVAAAPVPVTIDRFPDHPVVAPATLWLPAGSYRFSATSPDGGLLVSERTIPARARATVLFELPRPAPPRAPAVHVVDLSDGEPEAAHTGPPPEHEFGDLVPDKYRKKRNLDDPELGVRRRWSDPHGVPRLGIRLGGGLIDSTAGPATGTVSAAALVRAALAPRGLVIEGRLDVGERGAAAAKLWTAGAGAHLRWYPMLAGVSVAAGGRIELRTAAEVAGMAVERFGVGAAAAVAWEPGRRRFAIELRVEQAVTALAGGRPRAALLELGLNL